jgi:hypothetical protein
MSWLINYVASPTVFGILKGALENFIDGIDYDQFKMDFHSGTINLADLKVKPHLIQELGILPDTCKLKWSRVGKLHAKVKSYTSKQPIVVEISDVELVFINDTIVDESASNVDEEGGGNPFAAFSATSDSAWDLKKRGVDVAWSAFEFASNEDNMNKRIDGKKETTMKVERGVWKNLVSSFETCRDMLRVGILFFCVPIFILLSKFYCLCFPFHTFSFFCRTIYR